MKRIMAWIVAMVLLLGMAPGVWGASEEWNQEAQQVTGKVKALLGIGDEYTGFHSEYQTDEGVPLWVLNWSLGELRLTVEATSQGQVMEYRLDDGDYSSQEPGFAPSVPKVSDAQALKLAQAFIDKLLLEGESVKLDASQISRGGDEIWFYFDIALHGLPSPLFGRITLDGEDGTVISYRRTNPEHYRGGVDNPKPSVTLEQGRGTLQGTQKLQLEYTRQMENGTESRQAHLRYVPVSGDNYVVDAFTGKAVNLSQLWQEYYEESGDQESGGSKSDAGGGLSKVELEGLGKLDQVLEEKELDSLLRQMPQLALQDFQLAETAYYYNKEDDRYTASLSYTRQKGEVREYKIATVNASDGQLIRFFAFGDEEREALEGEAAMAKGRAFLETYFPQQFSQVGTYEGSSLQGEGVVLVRQANGVPFPENYYRMSFDKQTGDLLSFRGQWDEDVTFAGKEGIISLEQAENIWKEARPVELGYSAAPTDQGDKLMLAYQYTEEAKQVYGVDALSGEALRNQWEQVQVSYTDVKEGDSEILALAQMGVGFKSDLFQKDKALTQADLLAFLVSAQGQYYDPQVPEELESLYWSAYELGILEKNQRQEDALITRGQLVKIILDMSGYGKAAGMWQIYQCNFSDAGKIPKEYYGYAAIAQGLGMVKGNGSGRFAAQDTATREQMALMFYRFMDRTV